MKQSRSYNDGLGLSLFGQRVQPASPVTTVALRPTTRYRFRFASSPTPTPSATTATITAAIQAANAQYDKRYGSKSKHYKHQNVKKREQYNLKITTIGNDISIGATGERLMKIHEADTVQQLIGLLQPTFGPLQIPEDRKRTSQSTSAKKNRREIDLAAARDVYESCFLVHVTHLQDAIERTLADIDNHSDT